MNNALLTAIKRITGDEHAFSFDGARAARHRRRLASVADNATAYVAVALPDSVESLQALVQFAAAENLSLTHQPNAAGNGMRLGAPLPRGLVLDLQRMNRILEVNARSAYALVEPGVSYSQLYRHLQREQIPMWVDCDRDPDNSIAGSILDRHMGYTAYGDHMLMQCGLEVVTRDGNLLRTGMGALPNSDTWQLFKYNFGPYIDGLFTQSDLGVVSKVGLWLMPAPPKYFPFMATLSSPEALSALVDSLRPLIIGGAMPGTVVIANAAFEAASQHRRHDFLTRGSLDIAALSKALGHGIWTAYSALYGDAQSVEIMWELVGGTLNGIPGAKVCSGDACANDRANDRVWAERRELMRGVPAAAPLDLSRWGGPAHLRMTAIAPMQGDYALRMHALATEVLGPQGIDVLSEYTLNGRTLQQRIYIPYQSADGRVPPKTVDLAARLYDRLSGEGFAIIDESIELRRIFDAKQRTSALANFSTRIHSGLESAAVSASRATP